LALCCSLCLLLNKRLSVVHFPPLSRYFGPHREHFHFSPSLPGQEKTKRHHQETRAPAGCCWRLCARCVGLFVG
jgi:hypothetical protein